MRTSSPNLSFLATPDAEILIMEVVALYTARRFDERYCLANDERTKAPISFKILVEDIKTDLVSKSGLPTIRGSGDIDVGSWGSRITLSDDGGKMALPVYNFQTSDHSKMKFGRQVHGNTRSMCAKNELNRYEHIEFECFCFLSSKCDQNTGDQLQAKNVFFPILLHNFFISKHWESHPTYWCI